MADYNFYIRSYLGSSIPEKAFPGILQQAKAALERMKRIYRVAEATQAEEDMALCAMADGLYAYHKRGFGVSAASVGEVSVRYDTGNADKALPRELFRRASIYLDIRRGVA